MRPVLIALLALIGFVCVVSVAYRPSAAVVVLTASTAPQPPAVTRFEDDSKGNVEQHASPVHRNRTIDNTNNNSSKGTDRSLVGWGAEEEERTFHRSDPRCNSSSVSVSLWRPASCVDDLDWLLPWMRRRPQAEWVLADVGANKGYVLARWLELLAGDEVHTGHAVAKALFGIRYSKTFCGACNDCLDDPAPLLPRNVTASTLRIYGFEALPANFRFLQHFFENASAVRMIHAAVTDDTRNVSTVEFLDGNLGSEVGSIVNEDGAAGTGYSKAKAAQRVAVNVTRLDTALAHEPFIHVLTTDVEGYDMHVQDSARLLLEHGRVGVYQFEMWADVDYKEVFDRLAKWGFTCFYPTQYYPYPTSRKQLRRNPPVPFSKRTPLPKLARITDCWRPHLRFPAQWMNAICANFHAAPELKDIFLELERTTHQSVPLPKTYSTKQKMMQALQIRSKKRAERLLS